MALTSEVPRRDINTPIQKDRNLAEDIRLKLNPINLQMKGIIQDLAIGQQEHRHNEHSDQKRNKFHMMKYILNNKRQLHILGYFSQCLLNIC